MQFDLVDHRNDVGLFDQARQVPHLEVAHADGTDAPFEAEPFHRAPGFAVHLIPVPVVPFGDRPMDQVQVEVVGPERLHRFVERAQRRIEALVAVPQFAGDENILAVDAAFAYRGADAPFVAVNGGGVDVAVACGDGLFDCADGHFAVRGAERAETDARNFDAVTQFESILK